MPLCKPTKINCLLTDFHDLELQHGILFTHVYDRMREVTGKERCKSYQILIKHDVQLVTGLQIPGDSGCQNAVQGS